MATHLRQDNLDPGSAGIFAGPLRSLYTQCPGLGGYPKIYLSLILLVVALLAQDTTTSQVTDL